MDRAIDKPQRVCEAFHHMRRWPAKRRGRPAHDRQVRHVEPRSYISPFDGVVRRGKASAFESPRTAWNIDKARAVRRA